eukprot:3672867-Rhodomonas_salina.1
MSLLDDALRLCRSDGRAGSLEAEAGNQQRQHSRKLIRTKTLEQYLSMRNTRRRWTHSWVACGKTWHGDKRATYQPRRMPNLAREFGVHDVLSDHPGGNRSESVGLLKPTE